MSSQRSTFTAGFDYGERAGRRLDSISSSSTTSSSAPRTRQFVSRINTVSASESRKMAAQTKRDNKWEWPAFLDEEPPFHEATTERYAVIISRSPVRDLTLIPDDDWRIVDHARLFRTEEDPIPAALTQSKDVPKSVQKCLEIYTRKWSSVRKKYAHITQSRPSPRSAFIRKLPSHTFAVDTHVSDSLSASRVSVRDSMLSQVSGISEVAGCEELILDNLKVERDMDRRNKDRLSKRRACILHIADNYGSCRPEDYDLEVPLVRLGNNVKPPAPAPASKFLFELDEFRLSNVEMIEPFFVTAFLYDVEASTRVSEAFSCDVNDHAFMEGLLGTQRPEFTGAPEVKGPAADFRRAIFQISDYSDKRAESVFLVIRVDKVLHGDVAKDIDFYSKMNADVGKIRASAKAICQRLGRYQMPFAFAALTLRSALRTGEVGASERDLWVLPPEKLKDEDFSKLLLEAKDTDSSKLRKRRLNGHVKISLTPLKEDMMPNSVLTSHYQRVRPFAGDPQGYAVEMEEHFVTPLKYPHAEYKHLLFVQPMSVNLSSTSFRNIVCRIEVHDHETIKTETGMPGCLIGHGGAFVNEIYTPVSYHNKSPDFQCEVKIKLPEIMREDHHLLFTFMHVSCKEKGDSGPRDGKVIGYSWLKLYNTRGKIKDGRVALPIALQKPTFSLQRTATMSMSLDPDATAEQKRADDHKGMKWLDGRKNLFNVNLHAASTAYCPNTYIHEFLKYADILEHPREDIEATTVTNLNIVMHHVQSVDNIDESVHPYFYPLLQLLFAAVANYSGVRGDGEKISYDAFNAILEVVNLVHMTSVGHLKQLQTPTLLETYVKYAFDAQLRFPNTVVYLALAKHFLHIFASPSGDKPIQKRKTFCVAHSWFFFETILKSMAQYLTVHHKMGLPPSQRFPKEFYTVLHTLVDHLTLEVSTDQIRETRARDLTSSIGFFLRDLLSFADTHEVFSLLRLCLRNLHRTSVGLYISKEMLEQSRMHILQIVCSHEHYVPLNIPIEQVHLTSTPVAMNALSKVTAESPMSHVPTASPVRRQLRTSVKARPGSNHARSEPWCHLSASHYLAHLLVSEVCFTLNSEHKDSRKSAIRVLYVMLRKHELDARLDTKEKKQAVAALYFPFVLYLLDYKPLVYAASVQYAKLLNEPLTQQQKERFMPSFELSPSELRGLLLIFLHIVDACSSDVVRKWWRREKKTDSALITFFKFLILAATSFNYEGRETTIASEAKGSPKMERKRFTTAISTPRASALIKSTSEESTDGSFITSSATKHADPRISILSDVTLVGSTPLSANDRSLFVKASQNLSHQATLIILDLIEDGMVDFADELEDVHSDNELLDHVSHVLITLLLTNQSVDATRLIFHTLRSFVVKFPVAVFYAPTSDFAAKLCEHVLRQCNKHLSSVREVAISFLFFLMLKNFEDNNERNGMKNFSRMKAQITLSLSKIVGDKSSADWSDVNLRRAWQTILNYAEEYRGLKDGEEFKLQVKYLANQLYEILSDTAQMPQIEQDPLLAVDVHLRIADNYKESPILRLTWLSTLANKHEKLGNFAEAAMCKVHMAVLMSESYMHMPGCEYLERSYVDYEKISLNVDKESIIQSNALEEDLSSDSLMQRAAYINVIKGAIDSFNKAQMPEKANQMYEFIFRIFERDRDYGVLQEMHLELSKNYGAALKANKKERYFAEYYRIRFFGKIFGQEEERAPMGYVYRERGLTKLVEVASRLEAQYSQKYPGLIELIQDSKAIDPAALNPDKGYIQVTFLKPIPPASTTKTTSTLELNTNINQFVFETPFTQSGKARGSLADQYRRITTVTTSHYYPYMSRRLVIVNEEEKVLCPIEIAIDSLTTKAVEIEALANADSVNVTLLQLQLQGAVNTSVNEGPTEIAKVFLDPTKVGSEYDAQLVKKLCRTCNHFLKICEHALNIFEAQSSEGLKQLVENIMESFESVKLIIQKHVQVAKEKVKAIPRQRKPRKSQQIVGMQANDTSTEA